MPVPVTEISCDVQQQEKLLHAWQQQYTQLSGGCFAGEVCSLTLPGVKLFRESMSRAVFQAGALPTSRLAFGVPLAGRGRSLLCGEPAGHDLLLFSGSMGFEFLSPDDFEFYGVEIDCTALSDGLSVRLAEQLEQSLQHCAHGARVLALPAAAFETLSQWLRLALAGTTQPSAALSRLMLGQLLDRLSAVMPIASKTSARSHWHAVSAIRQWICTADNRLYDCPMSVAELSLRLGVSRRTLQNACKEITGLSPVQYLRCLRLGQARRLLLENACPVTEAATRLGFWHLSWFARDYCALFGELPSATLTRVKGFPSPPTPFPLVGEGSKDIP